MTDFSGIEDTLYNSDIFSIIDKIPDKSFDLIIFDPPYNLSKDFGNVKFSATNDAAYAEYLDKLLSAIVPKLKDTGTLYLCGDWKCSSVMYVVLSKYLTVINRITWARDKGRGASKNWKNAMEDIWFAVKDPNNYTFNLEDVKVKKLVKAPYRDENGNNKDWTTDDEGNNYRMTCPSNLWTDIVVPFWSMPENTEHPTQKPEKLIAKLIKASSNPGDFVFDPMSGSGTTLVTAKKLSRKFCGIEINRHYCRLSAKRLLTVNVPD